mmetsp:Transcript_10825/g.25646  ORF Transcript_10825/g.25646 Transcript_10825/m.25646 type:complete len:135 (+) Transcript_10825:4624-5028(+)
MRCHEMICNTSTGRCNVCVVVLFDGGSFENFSIGLDWIRLDGNGTVLSPASVQLERDSDPRFACLMSHASCRMPFATLYSELGIHCCIALRVVRSVPDQNGFLPKATTQHNATHQCLPPRTISPSEIRPPWPVP